MAFLLSRAEQLTSFLKEMRQYLCAMWKSNALSEQQMFERNVVVNKYITSLRDGCTLASEIKDSFTTYQMYLGENNPEKPLCMQTYMDTLAKEAERYVVSLKDQLEKQKSLFDQVKAILSSFPIPPQLNHLHGLLKVGINCVVKIELDALALVCHVYQALKNNSQTRSSFIDVVHTLDKPSLSIDFQEEYLAALEDFQGSVEKLNDTIVDSLQKLKTLVSRCSVTARETLQQSKFQDLLQQTILIAQEVECTFYIT